jgi:polyphosphate kinase
VAFPVESAELRARVDEELSLYLEDDSQTWNLQSNGEYSRADGARGVSAQARLLNMYDERVALIEP